MPGARRRARRRRGPGLALLRFLETQSRPANSCSSTNTSNQRMQRVLEKLGYQPSGVIHKLDPGDPELV